MKDFNFRGNDSRDNARNSMQDLATITNKALPVQKKRRTSVLGKSASELAQFKSDGLGIQSEESPISKFYALKSETLAENKITTSDNTAIQKKQVEEEEVQMKVNEVEQIQRKASEEDLNGKETILPKANNTGLPDNLKSGVENLSGYAMDDVKVHYNSAEPAQLGAHAYAQGTDIHVAPGQEKHLPHEAWHVAQQKQGRVKPTMQMKAGVQVNDDAGLENEADIMGSKALQQSSSNATIALQKKGIGSSYIQCVFSIRGKVINGIYGDVEAQIEKWFGNKKSKEVIESLTKWIERSDFDEDFPDVDSFIKAGMKACSLTRLNYFEGDEQPLYEYAKNYKSSDVDPSPAVESGTGIKETEASREHAKRLVDTLTLYYKNPPEGYTQQDFMSEPYMVGVLILSSGQIIASKSGSNKCKGFLFVLNELGYEAANMDDKNLKGFQEGYDIEAQQVVNTKTKHRHAYGGCALPKVLSRASKSGGYPTGVTEMYFSPKEARSVSAVGDNGKNQNFHHGTIVPSCDRCRDFAPEQIKGLPKKKSRTGGNLSKRKKDSNKPSKEDKRRDWRQDIQDQQNDYEFLEEERSNAIYEKGVDLGYEYGFSDGQMDNVYDALTPFAGLQASLNDIEYLDDLKQGFIDGYGEGFLDGRDE